MSFLKKLKTAIVISRPASWIFGPAAYLLGLVIGGDEFTLLNVVQILLLSFPLGFYMCGINDAYDIKTDRINKRKGNALWGATITEKDVPWIKQASLLVVALIFLSTLPTGNIAHILSTLFLLPIPYLYSAPPVRLKARPVLDSLTNAMVGFGPFAMGFSFFGGWGFLNLNFFLFSLCFSAAHAIGAMMDISEDRAVKIETIATRFGPRAAGLFAAAIFAINVPFAFAVMKSAGLIIAANSLICIWAAYRQTEESATKAMKLMLMLFFLWVVYAPISDILEIESINKEFVKSQI